MLGRRAGEAPMRLEVDPDHPTPGGEELHVGAEHLDRPESAVLADERLAFTGDLVAESSVDIGTLSPG
ncbi:MAG TPA: hypothetical protein VIZ67_05830 [Acidimicrobiales bacterium]